MLRKPHLTISLFVLFMFWTTVHYHKFIVTEKWTRGRSVTNTLESLAAVEQKNKSIPLLFYNRVGKSGSRSLRDIIRILAIKKNYVMHPSRNGRGDLFDEKDHYLEAMHISKLVRPGVYTSHLNFIDFAKHQINASVYYINMIRDPVDHMVSRYYFKIYGDDRLKRNENETSRPLDINECIQTKPSACFKPFRIGRYFCGYDKKRCNGTGVSLELAKKHIEDNYLLIGLTEEFDATVKLLEKMLPDYFEGASEVWKQIREDSLRDTKTKKKVLLLEETRKIVLDNMKVDYDLYNWVKRRFNEQKLKFGIS